MQVPARGRGRDMVAGALLILLAVLFMVGSLLKLAEFSGNITQGAKAYPTIVGAFHQTWGAWSFTSRGNDRLPAAIRDALDKDTQQLLGIAMILVAVVAAVGGVLLLTGLAARYRVARAVTVSAASMAAGLAAALLALVTPMGYVGTATKTLGAGYWVFVVAAVVAVPALVGVLVGRAPVPAPPMDSYGRPLQPRAGGLDIAVGVLLLPLAGLMVGSTFGHLLGSRTMWKVLNHTQIEGVPVVAGAVVALVAAVLSFVGHGKKAGIAGAAALFAIGLLLSLDIVDRELFGKVGFGDLGVAAWLLFVATGLALVVMVVAIAAATAAPRYRTPRIPVAPQYAPVAHHVMGMPPQGWVQTQQQWIPPQGPNSR
ncbi:hypothetical protein GPX89_38335 [Nocardia sp. ET3-3]|uniref:Uncharacterized protein n=1 Tax=Nocardia terrae TaxID=2675851 RepID=A0A7K1V8W4_9NOCA|nr:hypothetical protein [Nocardia terrae]MVU83085.1 hypothetical protein [Nocardia terrae]